MSRRLSTWIDENPKTAVISMLFIWVGEICWLSSRINS